MNNKLKPPCFVMFNGKRLRLRAVSAPNRRMIASGWTGLVAHLQNEKGTGIVEYRKLKAYNSGVQEAQ